MSIRILSSSLSSQISSGEIIERPASVVKEIIENSIDAGSQNIHVIVEESGFQSILVQDDGCGISKEDLLLAISHHATSKINTLSDLNSINTFGFRGEALASIRAISRLTLISSTKSSYEIAWKIYSEGFLDNNLILLKPIAHPRGTSVIVENLFFNMPNQLLFIKNKKIELLKIIEVIKIIALSHFNINFSLKHNKQLILKLNTISNENKKINRFQDIFNKININTLIEIKKRKHNIFLFGWISNPYDFKNSKNIQYCYINNRYIQNDIFISAICSAYYKITGKKNVSFVLYLNIASNRINIHPTKKIIKFHESETIYKFIYEVILDSLQEIKKKYLFKIYNYKHKININHYNQNTLHDLNNISLKSASLSLKKKYVSYNIKFLDNDGFKKYYSSIGKLLIIVHKYYGLLCHCNNFSLISFPVANGIIRKKKLEQEDIQKKIMSKYIFNNIKLQFTSSECIILIHNQEILSQIGFNLIFKKKYVILKSIPFFLETKNVEYIILKFFHFVLIKKKILITEVINWFYINFFIELKTWTYLQGISVLLEIEYSYPLLLKNPPPKLLQKININKALCMLKI